MKTFYRLLSLVLLFVWVSCSKDDLSISSGESTIAGTWRLFEQGYSSGYGYSVDDVSAIPLQALTFTKKGEVFKQGDQLNGILAYPYYRVTNHQEKLTIQFLNSKKELPVNHSGLKISGDTMSITPSCREGCHYRFVRIH